MLYRDDTLSSRRITYVLSPLPEVAANRKKKLEIYFNAAARTTHGDADRRAGPRKLGED